MLSLELSFMNLLIDLLCEFYVHYILLEILMLLLIDLLVEFYVHYICVNLVTLWTLLIYRPKKL